MRVKYIVFDVDGTLFTSEDIIAPAYAGAIKKFNHDNNASLVVPSLSEILDQVGNPAVQIFKNLFPDISIKQATEISQNSRDALIKSIYQNKGKLYKNVINTIIKLNKEDYILKLASNGKKDYVNAIINHYNIKNYFGEFIDLNHKNLKDKGDILIFYINKFKIAPSEMVMIGDRIHDLEAAKKSGCYFIGLNYGHGKRHELENAEFVLDDFAKIPVCIKKIQEKISKK